MAFAYVVSPLKQWQDIGGVNAVDGWVEVFIADTDDRATTYCDFNGTLNPEKIRIDNNGRAIIIADSARPYRIEFYNRNGGLMFTQYPVWCVASGGGMTMVDIESTDGSVSVQKTSSGGITTYDLSTNPEDDPAFLDWIKCSWYDLVDGAYVPRYASGTMSVGARGVVLSAGMHYHVTATVRANKSGATPFYDNIGVHFSLFDGENSVSVQEFTRIVDHSLGLSQDFQVDADIHVGSLDSQLVVSIDGAMEGVSFDLVSLDAHRIYSGVPKIPDGVARQDWVNQNFQKKLVAGENITIDPVTNVISSDGAPQVQSDWTESDTSDPSYIQNKPTLAAVATSGDYDDLSNKPSLAAVATSGDYDDLSNKPSIPAAQVQSDWSQSNSQAVDYIKNKPSLAAVATSGSYDDLSDKPSIPAPQEQADWTEQNSSDPAYIKNKPSLAAVATSGDYDDLSNKPNIPVVKTLVAGQNVSLDETDTTITINAEGGGGPVTQEQANWTENDPQAPSYIRNKPNLAAVATSGDYDDLSNKPTIPVVPQMKNLVAGQNVSITEDANGVTISASGAPQQQADWSQNDPQAVDYIKNKPTIPAAPVQSNWNESDSSSLAYIQNKPSLASVATSGDYDDLSNKPTIPAAQVQSDWSQSDNTQVDYIKNKPSLAAVATSGDYDDLSNKPTIPAAQVQSDWSQSDNTQVDYIKNKPSLASVATSGDYADLSNKPTIPAAQVQSDWSQSNSSAVDYIKNKPNLASVATSGSYNDLSDKPSIPAAQVQSDWTEQDTSSKAYIQNKPSLAAVATSGNYSDLNGTPTIPTVDQTYDGTSTDAQSGVAVAQAVSGKEDEFDAGEGLEFTTDGQGNRVLQVEGPVDIVAGPGIVIDNPDGNTLRVSMSNAYEEILYAASSDAGTTLSVNDYITLSESLTHFEKVKIYFVLQKSWGVCLSHEMYKVDGDTRIVLEQLWYREQSGYNNYWQTITFSKYNDINHTITLMDGSQRPLLQNTWGSTGLTLTVFKVVGINRIASN